MCPHVISTVMIPMVAGASPQALGGPGTALGVKDGEEEETEGRGTVQTNRLAFAECLLCVGLCTVPSRCPGWRRSRAAGWQAFFEECRNIFESKPGSLSIFSVITHQDLLYSAAI